MISQPDRRDLLNLMSQCLQLLRQLPSTLQHLHKQNNKSSLMQLAQTSLKFSQLATQSNLQTNNNQLSLFHRFGCKVLDVSSICLNHCNNVLIRELYIGLGDRIMGLKGMGKIGGATVSGCLLNVAAFIDGFMSRIMVIQKLSVSKSTILQIITSKQKSDSKSIKQHQKSTRNDNQIQSSIAIPLKIPQTPQMSQKSQIQIQPSTRTKQKFSILGLPDIDFSHTQKILNNNASPQQIYQQCLNRNKLISQLIKQYQSKYQLYVKKPQHKRNRQNPCYQPTSSMPMERNLGKNKKRFSKAKSKKTEYSNRDEGSKKYIMDDSQARTQVAELRESLLNQVYSYQRKQYFHINKVRIGEQEQQPPLHFAMDFPNVIHEKQNRTIQRTQSRPIQSQRMNSSKTQRMKTLALTLKNSSMMKTKDRLDNTSLISVGFK